jgi:predicted SAM-dependent methyltransferase
VNYILVKLKYKLIIRETKQLKLHLGCGDQHYSEYINIDFRKTTATDLVCDIRKLPYPDNSVEIIENYHVIEHLGRHELLEALKEWHRVLQPGGKIIIECPDFDQDIKEYIQGNEKRLDSIFGLQRFPGDSHLFGYNFNRLKNILTESGFTDIKTEEALDYHSKNEPCIRITGAKQQRV